MTNEDKAAKIRPWINADERITVDFIDQKDLNVEVTACTDEVVDLALETAFPHVRQSVVIPLKDIEIGEDETHYTRERGKPPRQGRLRLRTDLKRANVLSIV